MAQDELDGAYLSNLLHPNLQGDKAAFKNKNVELRKQILKRTDMPRRDSEENLSFWTRSKQRKMEDSLAEKANYPFLEIKKPVATASLVRRVKKRTIASMESVENDHALEKARERERVQTSPPVGGITGHPAIITDLTVGKLNPIYELRSSLIRS